MKKFKINTLIVGILSTLIFTSTATMAKTNTNTSDINKSFNPVVNATDKKTVYGGMILAYADILHFDFTKHTYEGLTPLSSNRNLNTLYDVFFWADSKIKGTSVYLMTQKMHSGDDNPYATCDYAECGYSFVPGYNDLKLVDVPQGRHTIKLVESTPEYNNPIAFYIDYMNFRVSSLGSYILNDPLASNSALTFTMPKQVASNVNLANYVGVFDVNTGNQILTSISLDSDNQTIIIDSITGQFPTGSNYELVVNPGIMFADGTESFEANVFDFTTTDSTSTPTPTPSIASNKLVTKDIKNSINIKATNPLATKGIKDNTKSKPSTALNNAYKLRNSIKK